MNQISKSAAAVLATSCVLTLIACGSSSEAGTGEDPINGTSGGTTSGDPPGGSSGEFGTTSGASGSSGDPKECAAQEAAATLAKKPVDIIFVIDNSGSMSDEILEVEKQINANFATIIEAAKIDYRVIMVTAHGAASSQRICVKAPLSGSTCSPIPAQPVETAKFFHHSITVNSTDAWCKLLTSYNTTDQFNKHTTGWGPLLRAGAFKVIAGISDDRISSSCTVGGTNKNFNDNNSAANAATAATDFDTTLLALAPAQFGTAAKRNYVYHSIVGVNWLGGGTPDFTKAIPSTDPVMATSCGNDAVNVGHGHQALSIKTGGVRYASCRKPGNLPADYSAVFKEMAKSVISGATVACEFPVPSAPAGETLDLSTVVPRYTPGGGGASVDFGQVANAAACAPDKFYIENNVVKLCPASCDKVQADPTASIKVLFGCKPKGAN